MLSSVMNSCVSNLNTVHRLLWSYSRHFFIKSIPAALIFAFYRTSIPLLGLSFSFNALQSRLRSIAAFSDAGNGPSMLWITCTWSISLSPGNIGCVSTISPIRHPMAQISHGLPYPIPSNNSGARYHLVATYSVYSGGLLLQCRANPKSHILRQCSSFKSTFSGLMSRWMISDLWQYSIALSNCVIYLRRCEMGMPSWFSSSTSKRVLDIYSNTRCNLFLRRNASFIRMIFSCLATFSILTSRNAVFLIMSSSSQSSLNFLIATISFVSLCLAF